jgi:hypothetical protein
MRTKKEITEPAIDDWLAVGTDGLASMNAGREPAHLLKELVQNAMDAQPHNGCVTL